MSDATAADNGTLPLRICAISTLKSNRACIVEYIQANRRAGITDFLLFMDDATAQSLDDLGPGIEQVLCDDAYWQRVVGGPAPDQLTERQRANLREAVARCRARGIPLAVHIDIDEVVLSADPLAETLVAEMGDADALIMPCLEARHSLQTTDLDTMFAAPYVLSHRPGLYGFLTMLCLRDGLAVTRSGFFGHTLGKYAFKVASPFERWDIHYPRGGPTEIRRSRSINLLHFDSVNYDLWRAKWNIRSGIDKFMVKKRKRQQRRVLRALRAGEQAARNLYRRWYTLSPWRFRALARLGTARELKSIAGAERLGLGTGPAPSP
ncbi:MAG: hypothetical protein H6907_21250 [Hyphomicrobiales bacterium]|nr:hypothetical protein [Hyphomicrobiales bacterium]MCP5374271.1 hypothetical protein [Hyphomicrobiales bacterium]